MNWRWIVPVTLVLVILDVFSGFVAYNSATWNLNHTQVLYRWGAVREVCLVFFPIFAGVLTVLVLTVSAAVAWASRGGR